jgi:hypothetical protein
MASQLRKSNYILSYVFDFVTSSTFTNFYILNKGLASATATSTVPAIGPTTSIAGSSTLSGLPTSTV